MKSVKFNARISKKKKKKKKNYFEKDHFERYYLSCVKKRREIGEK